MSSLFVQAQDTVINQIVDITFLEKYQKLSPQAVMEFDQPSAHIHVKRMPIINKNSHGDYYNLNGIFMRVNAGYTAEERHLEAYQKSLRDMSSLGGVLPPNYSSEIRKIQDREVLIIYLDEGKNVGSYSFFCSDDSKKKFFNGIMEFNLAQKEKASKILEEMLQSVRFK